MMARPAQEAASGEGGWSWLDRTCRRVVAARLAELQQGSLRIADSSGEQTFGRPDGLAATVEVRRPRFYRRLVAAGVAGVEDAYIDGDWDSAGLAELLRMFLQNQRPTSRLGGLLAAARGLRMRVAHALRRNTRRGSRRNIAAHYDLGNEFFATWLDDTLAYSSGVFLRPEASLADASREKFDRICRKLDLQPGDRLLEIGSGWGGFAMHAAQRYGCRVTTTTISRRQFELASRRVAEAGLTHRVTLLQQDYRDLAGQFDKIASIEMIEAVGHRYLDQFFGQCGRLLKSGGAAALQAIVMPERGYAAYLNSVDFIRRCVFPGGCLPSLGSLLESVGRTTAWRLLHAEDLAPHYADTLRWWRRSFEDQLPGLSAAGHEASFLRLWRYYLSFCEAAFQERQCGVMQLCWADRRRRDDGVEVSTRVASSLSEEAAAAPPCTVRRVAASPCLARRGDHVSA